ncbi:MAG TPA: ABC transporter permease [Alphaproteobacteria bacterium]|nr:ABC transporter permease [Alphaproteobacteria bacterium]MDP7426628.1 ABC transporter permease [Alphaproteobacteria bacterium]HJM50300.1 ABC transporter permease [Alphaproteobacteria bacterium]
MEGSGRYAIAMFAPITVLYLIFLIAPISFFLAMSVFKYSPLELYVVTVTGDNFLRLLGDDYYRAIIFRTLKIAGLTALFSLLLGYPLAYFLARTQSVWRGVLMFLVIAPLMTGVIVRTYGWIVLLGRQGTVNQVLQWTGLVDAPVKILETELAVLVALVHILMPYMVFPLFSSLASQDPNVEKAAATLGAGRLRTFIEVTLPLSRSGILMGSALVFTLTAGAVVTPELLGGKEVRMLGQMIYELVLTILNWPFASAIASILVLCQFSIIFLYFRGGRNRAA